MSQKDHKATYSQVSFPLENSNLNFNLESLPWLDSLKFTKHQIKYYTRNKNAFKVFSRYWNSELKAKLQQKKGLICKYFQSSPEVRAFPLCDHAPSTSTAHLDTLSITNQHDKWTLSLRHETWPAECLSELPLLLLSC